MRHIFFISAMVLLVSSMSYAQTGPGGVGSNNIFWYKASDLGLSNGSLISLVNDKTTNNLDASQTDNNLKPNYSTNLNQQINGADVMYFDGNDMLVVPSVNAINLSTGTNKALTMVFKTSDDITSTQFIYEEGGRINGLNLYISNGNLVYGIYNNSTYTSYITYALSTQTDYIVTGVFDGPNDAFKIYINGNYIDDISLVNFTLNAHTGAVGLGGINGRSHTITGEIEGAQYGFKGSIAEMVYYNEALNITEVDNLNDAVGTDYGLETDYSTLPVSLLSFTGKALQDGNHIVWSTASEQNNAYFLLSKSTDGVNFHEIAKIFGNGTTNELSNYEYIDNNTSSTSYYKLTQVDYNGDQTSFGIIAIQRQENTFDCFASQGQIKFQISNLHPEGTVRIYSTTGQIIYSQSVTQSTFNIPFSRLNTKKQVVIVQYESKGVIQTKKLLLI
jgi:hypothetical protein